MVSNSQLLSQQDLFFVRRSYRHLRRGLTQVPPAPREERGSGGEDTPQSFALIYAKN